ncbi:MAG: GNAT family N-acetyltransferase [Thiotrichales bacterium]
MSDFDLQLLPCGGVEHRADLAAFRARGWAVPHPWASGCLSDTASERLWVRVVAPDGVWKTAFAVELYPSRALPGTRIGRIERLGRAPQADMATWLGAALSATARKIPRLQRLEVQLFDEDCVRRQMLANALFAAGARRLKPPRGYSLTRVTDLSCADTTLLATFSARTRRSLRKTLDEGGLRVAPIDSSAYLARIAVLHRASFARTRAAPPPLMPTAMLADARGGETSCLLGAFDAEVAPPEDMVAFAWARLHGDYASYDTAGSVPVASGRGRAPGAALMWQLMRWARSRGAVWFDLGGTIPADAPADHPLHGIAAFKRGFAADEREVAIELMFTPATALARSVAALRGSLTWLRQRSGTGPDTGA